MMKKSNKNYTNFDEFAEIRRYPCSVCVSGIRIRYAYPVSVSGICYPLPAFSTVPERYTLCIFNILSLEDPLALKLGEELY